MPDFQVAGTREILKRHREISAELSELLKSVVELRMKDSQAETRAAQDFELQYRRSLVNRLDRIEPSCGWPVPGARSYSLYVAYVRIPAKVIMIVITGSGDRDHAQGDTARPKRRPRAEYCWLACCGPS
jgi:hypothetical protein